MGQNARKEFIIGCNYWASHAGVHMWSDWDINVVKEDFQRLAELGQDMVRVFPLWSDFQPLTMLYGPSGNSMEIRHGEIPYDDTEEGLAGINPCMVDRFKQMLDIAAACHLRVLVSLLTGWMSGRLFVPQALQGKNLLEDPMAMKWELRFVKYMVRHFKEHPAIYAWEHGNEYNVLANVSDHDAAWRWSMTIADAIRCEDPNRPVISGIHGLTLEGKWRIEDQGEIADVVTTHPYPAYTPHCFTDPLFSIKSLLHATAQSTYYGDLSGRPCMAEEIGTLCNMVADEETAAAYIRANCLSLLANGHEGLMWWCAAEQSQLRFPPYEWSACERELGLFRLNHEPKPVARELKWFVEWRNSLPFALPPHQRDAVCILSRDQDHWAVAYSSYILSKRAGFDLRFSTGKALPDSPVYFLPCLTGRALYGPEWRALLGKVEKGATLYLSLDDALLTDFENITGLRVIGNAERKPAAVCIRDENRQYSMNGKRRLFLQPTRAQVLLAEEDGNPAFTVASYGKGLVYFLAMPMETMLAQEPMIFMQERGHAYTEVYRRVMTGHCNRRVLDKPCADLGITEHPVSENHCYITAIQYNKAPCEGTLVLDKGWQLAAVHRGQAEKTAGGIRISVQGLDALLIEIKKQEDRRDKNDCSAPCKLT